MPQLRVLQWPRYLRAKRVLVLNTDSFNIMSKLRIAVDAMGGDFAPANEVAGAVEVFQYTNEDLEVILVGDKEKITPELAKRDAGCLPISTVHASQKITMEDSPTAALKQKKDSSLAVSMHLQKEGKADAVISAGNTGAVLSAATLILGRIKGVTRPTIGAFFPSIKRTSLLVDAGTNVDCRASMLAEFAAMGSIYVQRIFHIDRPTVGLLNIGEERSKGNSAVQEAYELLEKSSLNFIGNLEGRDVLKGKANVIVCDGFVGNVILKFGESVPSFLKTRLLEYASNNILRKLRIGLVKNPLKKSLKDMDYEEIGGVPVLGVKGVAIIGHGRSTPKAIRNMILKAAEVAKSQLDSHIAEALAGLSKA
jgi:glycerol-3-phosphate acyltransferase PlsX